MTDDEKLAHAIRMQFGLSPYEPSGTQLVLIKVALRQIQLAGRNPNKEDWRATVYSYCPSAGSWKYAGLDNSDLNTLLALATQAAKG